MKKYQVLKKIEDNGIIAVVRAENFDSAVRITEACQEGGINIIEITFTVPGAHDVIGELTKRYKGEEVLIGAGTVLDSETARIAILNGANFVVGPAFDIETIRLCNRYQIPCMPGAMTIKEVITAMEAGADIVKVFPGSVFGPEMIKAIKGPLPQASLLPTGGIDVLNAEEWLKAGSVALGVGGMLTAGAKRGDYKKVTEVAKMFVDIITKFRGDSNGK